MIDPKKTRIFPTPGNVVIRQDPATGMTKTGIYLPHTAPPAQGIVYAAGKTRHPESDSHLVSGAKVVYATYAGTKIEVDGEEFIIVQEDDILVVIE